MLLHIDGSKHRWLNDDRWYDLIVILDDATSEIYYAQLVEEESTRTVMAGLREVIETRGLFCSLYSDRGSHFFVTMKEGEKVDKHRLTQVGRAMKELGIQMIAAYSPQARGRSERSFGTWQGRLPQELRLADITTVEGANDLLRDRYIGEFNQKFSVSAAEKGTAFRRAGRTDLKITAEEWRAGRGGRYNRDFAMSPQQKAESLGIKFDKLTPGYLNLCIRSGNQLLTSGHVSTLKGKLGAGTTTAEGYEAARDCAVKVLQSVWNAHGTLGGLRVLKVLGCVNSAPEFIEQHLVINGASDLLHEIFGKQTDGYHARSALGFASLPTGAAVEVEAVFEIK